MTLNGKLITPGSKILIRPLAVAQAVRKAGFAGRATIIHPEEPQFIEAVVEDISTAGDVPSLRETINGPFEPSTEVVVAIVPKAAQIISGAVRGGGVEIAFTDHKYRIAIKREQLIDVIEPPMPHQTSII